MKLTATRDLVTHVCGGPAAGSGAATGSDSEGWERPLTFVRSELGTEALLQEGGGKHARRAPGHSGHLSPPTRVFPRALSVVKCQLGKQKPGATRGVWRFLLKSASSEGLLSTVRLGPAAPLGPRTLLMGGRGPGQTARRGGAMLSPSRAASRQGWGKEAHHSNPSADPGQPCGKPAAGFQSWPG